MNPFISIIVPVYNAEKTLNRCIDSIINQTYINWELLLINDGSNDNSGNICDEYVTKDNRIKVFHKENGGVSSARNLGLDNARGEWITFVDSDDWLLEDVLNLDFSLLKEDIILFSYYHKGRDSNELMALMKENIVLNSSKELKDFYNITLQEGAFKTIWSKLFKRKLINNLRFDKNIPIGEDHLFFLYYLLSVKSLRYVSKPFYVYDISLTSSIKYRIDVNKSIYIMKSILSVYNNLELSNLNFEKDIFCTYKLLCQEYIFREPQLWYNDPFIKNYYKRIRKECTLLYKIRYKFMSYSFVIRLFR